MTLVSRRATRMEEGRGDLLLYPVLSCSFSTLNVPYVFICHLSNVL
jgi:hypothetical protein